MYIPLNLIEELSQDKFESAWRLKVKLKQLKTKIFGGGTMKIWQLIEKPTKALLMVSLSYEEIFYFKKSFSEPIKQSYKLNTRRNIPF